MLDISPSRFAPGLLALALLGGGCAREISVYRVERHELVETVVATGRVRAPARVRVGARIAGTVAALSAREGQAVRAGDLLLSLDDAEARADLAAAEAARQQAEARLTAVERVRVQVAASGVARAEANHLDAERQHGRARALLAAGLISQAELDSAERTLEVARRDLEIARQEAASAGPQGPEAREARAAVAAAEAQRQASAVRLGFTRVLAPVDGVLLERLVEEGDVVQPGQALFTLARVGRTELIAEPDERNLARLAAGQKGLASADAFPGQSFPVEVFYVAPSVDPTRGTIEVRLEVSAPPAYLRPDMTVSVDVETGRKPGALVLPADAVRDGATLRPWVLVVRAGRAERQGVTLGLRGEAKVEILSGLAEGDAVVPASLRLDVGARVRAAAKGGS
ncbi:MAG TPA: efflux RND transporter periplasmic adaptor subunit [Thermoanaerobaculia bacterium]|nr:efflux RND transporter periplasmic adaptor subunit [Thermoanaerobaculia bacterium]